MTMNFQRQAIIGMMKNKLLNLIVILQKLRMMIMQQPKKPDFTIRITKLSNGIKTTTLKVYIGTVMMKDSKMAIRKGMMMAITMISGSEVDIMHI
jgi:hypothetical protein